MALYLQVIHEGSDQNFIILQLGERAAEEEETQFINRRSNWEEFRRVLQRDVQPIQPIEGRADIERTITILEDDIKVALSASTTETVIRRVANPLGELPDETKRLLGECPRAKRRVQRTKLEDDKLVYNQLSRRVKAALQEQRQAKWNQYLTSLVPQQPSMWKIQRVLRLPRTPTPSISGEDDTYTQQKKADACATVWNCRTNSTTMTKTGQTKLRGEPAGCSHAGRRCHRPCPIR